MHEHNSHNTKSSTDLHITDLDPPSLTDITTSPTFYELERSSPESTNHVKSQIQPVSVNSSSISTNVSSYVRSAPPIAYDLASHHALGGGSYVFKKDYAKYLQTLLPAEVQRTEVNIIIQPNSSPHIGTMCSLGLAFVVARRLKDLGMDVIVRCDLWDQAKGEEQIIEGVKYQRSLRSTGGFDEFLPDYVHILGALAKRYDVEYKLRFEEEFLRQPGMPGVLQKIIEDREEIGKCLMPSSGVLALRAACPKCGLVDKYGIHNRYSENHTKVSFRCPQHGFFEHSILTEPHLFQFNCQLFNLVMGRFYQQVDYGWIEICGSDYAGFWQEQLLWRLLSKPVIIVYTPLISDWSGSKVSKSLYLEKTAYNYLCQAGQEYLLSYRVLRDEGKDLNVLWQEIEKWVDEPYRLFRGYSLHYVHLLFDGHETHLGVIHETKGDGSCERVNEVSAGGEGLVM